LLLAGRRQDEQDPSPLPEAPQRWSVPRCHWIRGSTTTSASGSSYRSRCDLWKSWARPRKPSPILRDKIVTIQIGVNSMLSRDTQRYPAEIGLRSPAGSLCVRYLSSHRPRNELNDLMMRGFLIAVLDGIRFGLGILIVLCAVEIISWIGGPNERESDT
jgi:hypothetical protein